MAKVAERLIILSDVANGLLSRLHMMLDFAKPSCLTPEMDKVLKTLKNEFPQAVTHDMSKVNGFDAFKKRGAEIVEAITDYYTTFLDVIHFTEEASKLFTEIAGSRNIRFQLKENSDFLFQFFTLFTRYIQTHLLLSQFSDAQMYTAAYAKAYHVVKGNTENNFNQIAAHIEKYSQNTMKKMQAEFESLTWVVFEGLSQLAKIVNNWSNLPETLQKERVFTLIDEPRLASLPVAEKQHLELLSLDKANHWFVLGCLACPGVFYSEPSLVDSFGNAIKNDIVLPLFRERIYNHWPDVEETFDSFRKDKFRLSKLWKPIKEIQNSKDQTILLHARMRTLMRVELESLCSFFSDFPYCLPPKIQMVFAALRLAREEILWYFRHMKAQETAQQGGLFSKKWAIETDPQIPQLIFLFYRLHSLVRKYKPTIQSYYLELITKSDLQTIEALLYPVLQSLSPEGACAQLLSSFTSSFQGKTINNSLENERLNWYRASAILTLKSQEEKIPDNFEPLKLLSQAMQTLVTHTRCVDCIDSSLRQNASLGALYFYRTDLIEVMKSVLQPTLVGSQAHTVMVFPKIVQQGLHNIHRLCPEETSIIGKECVAQTNAMFSTIAHTLSHSLTIYLQEVRQLRKGTSLQAVLDRFNASIPQSSSSAEPQAAPLPGYESYHASLASLENARKYRKLATELAAALCLHRNDQDPEWDPYRGDKDESGAKFAAATLTVYNIRFSPIEYAHEAIQNSFRTLLREIVLPGLGNRAALSASAPSGSFANIYGGAVINRPTIILQELTDLHVAFSSVVDTFLPVSFSEQVTKEVILQEFSGLEEGSSECLLPSAIHTDDSKTPQTTNAANAAQFEEKDQGEPLAKHIITFYYRLFSRDLSDVGIFYSPLRRCFIARPTKQGVFLDVESFTDVTELRALALLCGPSCLRLLDRLLLRIVSKHFRSVKELISANHTAMLALQGHFTDSAVVAEQVAQLQQTDSAVSLFCQIGCILQFRQLLREALRFQAKHYIPGIQSSLEIAFNHIKDCAQNSDELQLALTQSSPEMMQHLLLPSSSSSSSAASTPSISNLAALLATLCYDAGVDVDSREGDAALRSALAKFKNQISDQTHLSFLPEFAACLFTSNRLRNSVYTVEQEAHISTNAHTMCYAVRSLIVAFGHITLKSEQHTPVNKRIQNDLEKFLKSTCHILLFMLQSPAFYGNNSPKAPENPSSILPPPDNLNNTQKALAMGASSFSLTPELGTSGAALMLEKFVEASCGRLSYTTLESVFPFTLIRTNFIQLFEKQTPNFSFAPVADESD